MSGITRSDVEYVAQLAQLALTEEEKTLFADQLHKFLAHTDKLHELDTTDVPPTMWAVSLQNVVRADEVQPSCPREILLASAPEPQAGYFRVPRILDEE